MGGVYLSKKELRAYRKYQVYFDESQDLEKILKQANIEKRTQIVSRSKTSLQVAKEVRLTLAKNLVGCEKQLAKFDQKLQRVKKKISETAKKKMIFFLGEIKSRLPQLIIARDGFVLDLIEHGHLETFESELAYVMWSRKDLSSYENYLLIGVGESKKKVQALNTEKIGKYKVNVFFRGALTPGISQVNFLNTLVSSNL